MSSWNRLRLAVLPVALCLLGIAIPSSAQAAGTSASAVPGELIVGFSNDSTRHAQRAAAAVVGGTITDRLAPIDGADDPVDVGAPDPAAMAVIASEREAVRTALGVLPAEQRQAIELAYFAGLTQQEISERLAMPLGTVKTRVRLGMKKLRLALSLEAESTAVG